MIHYTVHGERKKIFGGTYTWTRYVSANSAQEARKIAKNDIQKTFPDWKITVTSVENR